MAVQVMAGRTPWGGARVNEYVSGLGQNLACASDPDQAFTFHVLYSTNVGAHAFPGAYVFVSSAVISVAESEAELAWFLAHGIAHVNARHGQRKAHRSTLFTLLTAAPLALGQRLACWPWLVVLYSHRLLMRGLIASPSVKRIGLPQSIWLELDTIPRGPRVPWRSHGI